MDFFKSEEEFLAFFVLIKIFFKKMHQAKSKKDKNKYPLVQICHSPIKIRQKLQKNISNRNARNKRSRTYFQGPFFKKYLLIPKMYCAKNHAKKNRYCHNEKVLITLYSGPRSESFDSISSTLDTCVSLFSIVG